MVRTATIFALLALAAGPARAQHEHANPGAAPSRPPLYGTLGRWGHAVTTARPEAQKYFDQGLALAYGFNHEEAARAFRETARLDPACAMAWWGVALVAGPHINNPMDDAHAKIAWDALERMQAARAANSSLRPAELAFMDALAKRYSSTNANRAALDSAYADAMRVVAKHFPDDADAQVLFAESLMDLSPWNQWTVDGHMTPGTGEVVATLEAALKRWPNHPGANHLYVHAIEASPHPEKALAAARRLETLVPGAGHLVHMPSHIYARVERYDDARRVNERAVAVDEDYLAREKPEGFYPMMYYNHNVHFIWFASTMQGRSAEALAAAKKLWANIPPDMARGMFMFEFWPGAVYATLARFGRWDEILKEPPPPVDLRGERYVWHYARGMAFAAQGDFPAADVELDSMRVNTLAVPLDAVISINGAGMVQRIGLHALAGTIAMRQKDHDEAITELTLAVATEDSLHYDEPPTWYYPVRQSLGAALLEAGKPAEAEKVYREDLARHPGNGWSLFGLARALTAQGHASEAARIEARFRKAWSKADVKLTASVF